MDSSAFTIRPFEATDSLEDLNALLREAYRPLAENGIEFSAASEDVEATRRNIAEGECYLGFVDGELAATVVLRPSGARPFGVHPVKWYRGKGVANFGRLAVRPKFQGAKLGVELLGFIEARARDLGCTELALDTSERAGHLIEYYSRIGYLPVDQHQWRDKSYRSVILSKSLAESGRLT
jgi:GNAT superfamily N-acetyltransferase